MGDLISDCIASGVKLAGHQHGLLYGTREIAIVGMSAKVITGVRMTSDSGGGLSHISDEIVERQWSKGLSMFGFGSIIDNQLIGKIDYFETRSQPIASNGH